MSRSWLPRTLPFALVLSLFCGVPIFMPTFVGQWLSPVKDYWGLFPLGALLLCSLIVTLSDLWVKDVARTPTYYLTQISLLLVALAQAVLWHQGDIVLLMHGMVVLDPLGHLLALLATIAMMLSLVYARPYAAQHEFLQGELFSLALFALLGIYVMAFANSFLTAYLGLELMSLSLYALVALRRDHVDATEAAMKYFVLGALASGFMLYGMSMIYGATGTLVLPEVYEIIATDMINPVFLSLGLVFVVAGLAFKLGVVPFHMWVPDVYQGSPTGVTLLLAGAPKFAAFALTFRLLVQALPQLAENWHQMLIFLAVASLVLGNLAAIAQSNFKRMLAYSAIAQMGFMLLGFTPFFDPSTPHGVQQYNMLDGLAYAMFYLLSYVLTTLGALGIVSVLSRHGHEFDELVDLKGLAKRSPWCAGMMAVYMFSLAGLPPTVGFIAKLSVLQALIGTEEPLFMVLALIAVLFSLIGAFYYIRVVKIMTFDESTDTSALELSPGIQAVLSINGLLVLVLGVVPGGVLVWCTQAIVMSSRM